MRSGTSRNTKRKLTLYNTLKLDPGYEGYLNGQLRAGKLLKYKFRSGTSGLGEELGRRMPERTKCHVCEKKVMESVHHFVWECPAYEKNRETWKEYVVNKLDGNDKIVFVDQLNDRGMFVNMVLGGKVRGMSEVGIKLVSKFSEKLLYIMWQYRKTKMFPVAKQQTRQSMLCGVNGLNDYG